MIPPVLRVVAAYVEQFRTGTERPEERRREALVLLLVLVVGMWIPVFIAVYGALGLGVPCVALFGLGLLFLALPFLLRRSGSISLVVALKLGGLVVVGGVIASCTGGLGAPVMTWMVGFPLVGVLLVGLRFGLAWLLAITAVGCLFGGLQLAGFPAPNLLSEQSQGVVALFSFPGVATMMFLIAWGFEGTRARMAAELEAASEDARHAHVEVGLVLDSVDEGLVLVDAEGRASGERSAAAERLLGPIAAGQPFWEIITPHAPEAAEWLRLAWPTLSDPVVPPEVGLSQLPDTLRFGQHVFRVRYRPVSDDAEWRGAVVSLRDVSAEQEVQQATQAQRELHRLAARVVRDPVGVRELLDEGRRLLQEVRASSAGRSQQIRLLHTLKGNAALSGLDRVSELCHALETRAESQDLDEAALQPLVSAWSEVEQRARSLVGRAAPELDVSREDQAALLAAIEGGAPTETLAELVRGWSDEPVGRRFERLAEQARSLAFRLGKGGLDVEIEASGLRLPAERYASFWSAIVHCVRNAVDHGLEDVTTRVQSGKPRRGRLRLEAEPQPDGGVRIALSDDGRGVDWDALRSKAAEHGLPPGMAPEALFFAGGLSSKSQVTNVSGRGVGTSAVQQVVSQMGGTCAVRSARGEGTTLEFTFPAEVRAAEPVDIEDSLIGSAEL